HLVAVARAAVGDVDADRDAAAGTAGGERHAARAEREVGVREGRVTAAGAEGVERRAAIVEVRGAVLDVVVGHGGGEGGAARRRGGRGCSRRTARRRRRCRAPGSSW